ncbi:MAG TPA: nickel pincer cofactor biosynthesis protein LarB [Kofleriaceae bacterium]|nr:nickel pincer cofactor biosynthesis protein LarB [Kofleriaceae bacterium]
MDESRLRRLLEAVARGEVAPAAAAVELELATGAAFAEDPDDAVLDLVREARTGAPEVVLGEWKTAEQVAAILRGLAAGGRGALATRIAPDKADAVREALPEARYVAVARALVIEATSPRDVVGTVAIVCAGTSDLPVAEEAAMTAEFLGARVRRIVDVGVAGLHRLLSRLSEIRTADAVVVVAGMEGALPSVVAGLCDRPLIAVPTSVGYGVGAGGLAALAAMLSSCAPGVTVVNIDNGFGAAVAAVRCARAAAAKGHGA